MDQERHDRAAVCQRLPIITHIILFYVPIS
jgi:hypothetical protein